MVTPGLSELKNPTKRFNQMDRDHLQRQHALASKTHYVDFRMRRKFEQLRGSWALRQEVANDRLRMQIQIQQRTMRNALESEHKHIQSFQTHMNLPPHLQQRLGELQQQLSM